MGEGEQSMGRLKCMGQIVLGAMNGTWEFNVLGNKGLRDRVGRWGACQYKVPGRSESCGVMVF